MHHVEEITPVFSHVLLLKGGPGLAQGEKANVLASAWLSRAFGISVKVQEASRCYTMTVTPKSRAVM